MEKIKRKYLTKEITTLDKDTGELVQRESEHMYHSPIEPSFIKMYIEKLGSISRLSPGVIKCFIAIISRTSYDNIVYLLKDDKEFIYRVFDIKEDLLTKAITALTKGKFMIRLSGGKYLINPDYFAKGSWVDIKRVRIQYDITKDGTKGLVIFSKE